MRYRMTTSRITAALILLFAIGVGFFVYHTETTPDSRYAFSYGLDLVGGTELIYQADLSAISSADTNATMDALRDVVERRVNLFGVSEPLVQVEQSSPLAGEVEHRIIVELPGVTDVEEAVRRLGQTPVLEFMLVGEQAGTTTTTFIPTGLTGRQVAHASVDLTSGRGVVQEPKVSLKFNSDGADLFAKITKEHVGTPLAIFLDGELISSPVIREEIKGGTASISGNFSIEEAQNLVRDLNFGALPAPIELVQTQTVGATLGQSTLEKGVFAGIVGLFGVTLFMVLWYRLPGLFASIALASYVAIMLAIFKLIPVTLTASGIAGFILSIGMAVDANVLIFERIKEELRNGHVLNDAIKSGFSRAWLAIRDGHFTALISAIVLFWVGTSVVQGFALTYGIGIIISMLSAISLTRPFLLAVSNMSEKTAKVLFGSGVKN